MLVIRQNIRYFHKNKRERFRAARAEALSRRKKEEIKKKREEWKKDPINSLFNCLEPIRDALINFAMEVYKALKPAMDNLNCFLNPPECPKFKPKNKPENKHIINPVWNKWNNFKNPLKRRENHGKIS